MIESSASENLDTEKNIVYSINYTVAGAELGVQSCGCKLTYMVKSKEFVIANL